MGARLVRGTSTAFSTMQFREGLRMGWYEMTSARNEYRERCKVSEVPMHREVVEGWMAALVIIICPIVPHWSETQWKVLGKKGLAVHAPWPSVAEEDKLMSRQSKFLRDSVKSFRNSAKKMIKNVMQFASFMKREADEVGTAALELRMPYDQKAILVDSLQYINSQIGRDEPIVINMDTDGEAGQKIPDKVPSNVTPGKPYLWLN